MLPVASALSPAERQSLAEYVSGLAAATAGPAPAPAAGVALGPVLATRGRWSSGLPGCDQCHGPGGVGVGSAFPPLAGQPAAYQVNQLHAWQHGTRPPGPLGLMSTIAGKLSDADIQAVSAYYQSWPATVPAARASRP
ncbi:MAG: c-type cytochrome, partial [Gemmatimonadaceae bacterium]